MTRVKRNHELPFWSWERDTQAFAQKRSPRNPTLEKLAIAVSETHPVRVWPPCAGSALLLLGVRRLQLSVGRGGNPGALRRCIPSLHYGDQA